MPNLRSIFDKRISKQKLKHKVALRPGFIKKFFLLQGFDCCSENSISFHYVGPQYMYAMEYILYHLQPHVLQVQQNMQS